MFDALFTTRSTVTDHRGLMEADKGLGRRFNELVRAGGVLKSDNKMYVSLAHDERDVGDTMAAFRQAARRLDQDPVAR